MIVSSVFIVIERKSTPKHIASNTDRTESLEITESRPITEPEDKKELSEQPVVIHEKRGSVGQLFNKKNPEPLIIPENSRIAAKKQNDSRQEIELKVADKYISSEQPEVITPSPLRAKRTSPLKADGKVISSEDNMPVAGVTIVVKGETQE